MQKVVIVGGVAGGASAAARIRRLDEKAQITVFERSGYISYANCGLPYYVGGIITDREELTLQTPASFKRRFEIDMRVHHEVTAIHPEKKTVTVHNLDTDEVFEETYDKLVLSPGARPARPPFPGVDSEKIFTLRTVEDTLNIRKYIEDNKPGSAVLVGGGFIGLELAENMKEAGISVTVVEMQKQLMNQLDADMASFVHAKLRSKGIELLLGNSVEGFEETEKGLKVSLKGGAILETEMVVLAIGVTPDTALAKEAGLELGIRGSIAVNDKMETSVPDIYAVGDAVQIKNFVTGEDTLIPLAGPANKQGRIAADNICGLDSHYKGAQGSSVIKLFDMTVASTGIKEEAAKKAGISYERVYLSPANHAGYYPGGKVLNMKMLFEKGTWKILGAQIVGSDGADKRIDVIATAMRAGMTGPDLAELDLAYAPPYSSAKDPVNMAGFMIENIATGKLKQFHYNEIESLPQDGSVTLLDVRTKGEFDDGHVGGFLHIPVDELRKHLDELPKDKPLYVMCQSGLRSYIANRMLAQEGFDCYNLSGGYRLYQVVKKDRAAAEKTYPCGMDR
ncbi:MAG: CoA-disulfide reductase [Acetatifactor sp.]|nr:CoA-disulfide reductase [Acetatifactor sp.]